MRGVMRRWLQIAAVLGGERSITAGDFRMKGWRLRCLFTAVCGIALATVLSPGPAAQAAAEQTKLNAVSVHMEASEQGVVYQQYANRYVVGPNGWVEWKVTVKERVVGFASGTVYDFDKESVNYTERKRAVILRQEGDHTLVFRFEPGPSSPSGKLTFDRQMSLDGLIRYDAVRPSDGQTVIQSTNFIDMSNIGNMATAQFKREYPTLSITPSPDDLRRSGQAPSGLNVDRIIVDVKDPVLDAQDFEFKYRFTAGSYKQSVDWTTMAERNYIAVPQAARNQAAHLDIEVRDPGGNWRPYMYFYPGPGGMVESRVTINPFDIIAGESLGMYLRLLGLEELHPSQRANALGAGKSDFKYLQQQYQLPRNTYPWLGVFLFSTGQRSVSGYSGYADVDLTRSGYLWKDSPELPVDDLPVVPFSQTQRAVETNPLSGRQMEGHWAVIDSEDTRNLGEGTHYLFVKTVDAVTGGYTWQQVYYDADRALTDKNAKNFVQVKLVKDKTPLDIRFGSQPFVRGDYVVDTVVSDNVGVGAVQYMVSSYDFCLRSPGSCESMGEKWVDVPLGSDGKKVHIPVDTAAFQSDMAGGAMLHVYVRAVELRHKNIPYADNPFAAGNRANIISGMQSYTVLRGSEELEVKAAYIDRVDGQGRLAAAPSHRVRLYTHAVGFLAAEGDVRYRLETSSGAVIQDWKTVPSGQELVLAGANGAYVLRAYALNVEGVKSSREYTLSYIIGSAASASITSATFSTTDMTNQDVTLTLESSVPVKILNWSGIDPDVLAQKHTLTIKNSTSFDTPTTVQYQANGEAVESIAVSVGQVDKSGFGHLGGAGYILYTPNQPTADEVTAHLYVGKRVKPGSGDGISYRNGWLSYTFPANGEHVFEAEDAAGSPLRASVNESNRKATVQWIDNSTPSVSIAYSTKAATNKPVTATIQLPAGLTIVNNGGSPTYTFTSNGDFTYLVKDEGGVLREYKAYVANIDKEPPALVLHGALTYPVYQGLPFVFDEPGFTAIDSYDGDVTANVQVTQEVDVYKGGYYEIIYTVSDSAGNVARKTRGVSVMEMNGINVFVNQIRLRGDVTVPRGTLRFDIVGQENDELVFLYLPGKHTISAFKSRGTPVVGQTLTINEPGWYTFFVQDRERRTFVGQIHVQ